MDETTKARIVTLRLSEELHARLVAMAHRDTRSLNSEILVLLREALDTRNEARKAP